MMLLFWYVEMLVKQEDRNLNLGMLVYCFKPFVLIVYDDAFIILLEIVEITLVCSFRYLNLDIFEVQHHKFS